MRSLELYLLVFCARYLDLMTTYYSVYNSFMKVVFISATSLQIFWIKHYLKEDNDEIYRPYNPDMDTVSHWKYLVAPCAVLAFISHYIGSKYTGYGFNLMELLWTFSIYLESVAMLPQLVLVWYHRRVERWAGFYIFAMGLYRVFYILNWIYRANYEYGYRHHWLVYFCGVLQTILYADFFYYACTKRERPLLSWRRTVAQRTAVDAQAAEPLLVESTDAEMHVV